MSKLPKIRNPLKTFATCMTTKAAHREAPIYAYQFEVKSRNDTFAHK